MNMVLWDLFKKTRKPHVELTKEEVVEQIKQAWWDLYVSNLPRPVVIDAQTDEKNTPELFKKEVPQGFSIDPLTWITYFNCKDIPDFATKDDAKKYCRTIGQHETAHFTLCPGSKRMDVRLVDAAMKGLRNPDGNLAHIVTNYFGDWVIDHSLGVAKYGREDFSDMTRWRLRTTIEDVLNRTRDPSPAWKVLVGVYEGLFQEKLGLEKAGDLGYSEQNAIKSCLEIMGKDFRDSSTWPEKVRGIASVLESILRNSDKNKKKNRNQDSQSGSGPGIEMPDDVKRQMGRPSESPLTPIPGGKDNSQEAEGNSESGKPIDGEVLDEVFKLNRNNPGQFAGVLGAVSSVTPDEAMRLMYRARAREYLIKVTEKRDNGSYGTPSGYRGWDIGDPVLGRGGLEIIPSMSATGVILPGITTLKRERQVVDLPGSLKQIADLLWIIDSSGSMDWNPEAADENQRGAFDKAIIAVEAGTLYALDHGAKVAIINFSGEGNIKYQEFTRNLDKAEQAIMLRYGRGTVFPSSVFENFMNQNKNRVVTCMVSDFDISNRDETERSLIKHTNEHNPTYLFDISGSYELAKRLEKYPGVTRFVTPNLSDLKDKVIGKLKQDYKIRK